MVEVPFRRANGSIIGTTVSATPLFREDGEYLGTLAMVRDNTELRRSQKAVAMRLRQLETIAELGRAILAGISLEELLEQAVPAVAEALEVDLVSVLKRLPDGNFRVIVGYGWGDVTEKPIIQADASQSGFMLAAGEQWLIVDDIETERRFTPRPISSRAGFAVA